MSYVCVHHGLFHYCTCVQTLLGGMECTLGKIISCIKVEEPLVDRLVLSLSLSLSLSTLLSHPNFLDTFGIVFETNSGVKWLTLLFLAFLQTL